MFPKHDAILSFTAITELLFTRLTESMFRLAMAALGGARSACLLVERSQGVLRQSLLSCANLKGHSIYDIFGYVI